MKVTTQSTTARIIRRYAIADGPIVAMAYSNPPKNIRVTGGNIEYTLKDGDWVVKDSFAASVNGIVLKKDGTDSKNNHSRNAGEDWNASYRAGRLVIAEGWEWLQEIIDLLRPNGDLTMTVLNDHEVTG